MLQDGLTRAEARGLVAALPDQLDLITIQKIVRAAKLPMSPGVGGAGRAGRTKKVVHDEMRAHLSLPTLFSTVPTGIAIPPPSAPPSLPQPPPALANQAAALEAGWSPDELSAAAALYDSALYPSPAEPPVVTDPKSSKSPPPPPTIGSHISPPPTVQSATNVPMVDNVVRRGDANFNLLSPIQQATYELRIDEKTGDTFYTFIFVLDKMHADDVAATLHRRLHIGMDLIKRLGHRASDAPEHVAHATTLACEHCAAANATRVSHNHSAYHPSHPGRLIHADIAGPFTDAAVGGARYLLLLTDDCWRVL